jgi:hypothetical protein
MDKVGWLRYTHQWASRIDILHPSVNLFVCPECKVDQLLLRLQLYAEGLQVYSLDVDYFG